jgi:hypothetical protein
MSIFKDVRFNIHTVQASREKVKESLEVFLFMSFLLS